MIFKRIFCLVKFLLVFTLTTNAYFSQAQDCTQLLTQAQAWYKEGKLEEIEKSLVKCIPDGFLNKVELVSAYELMIKTYIFTNRSEIADSLAAIVLKIDPEYDVFASTHPEEYISLFQNYQRYPKYLFSMIAGLNYSIVEGIDDYSFSSPSDKGKFTGKLGFQLGLMGSTSLSDYSRIRLGLYYQVLNTQFVQPMFGFAEMTVLEKHSVLFVPITYQYNFEPWDVNDKLTYYAFGGFAPRILLSAISQMDRANLAGTSPDVELFDVNVKPLRPGITWTLNAGIGAKYRIGSNYLIAELGFQYGFNNQSKKGQRLSNPQLIYELGYIDDNYRLHNLMVQVGYQKAIYKPKKLKKK
ncbi:MAG: hypothetical protein OHK0057_27540 [Thermoflexibacter sp.]